MEQAKELTIDDLLARLRCPLSGKLFGKPVVASNGCVYEETELINYLEGPNELGLSQSYKEIVPVQTLINYLIERYPELKDEQYKYTYDPSKFKRSCMRNIDKIKKDIENNRFDNLLQYDNFRISALSYMYYNHVLKHANENVLAHVISRTTDINEKIDDNNLYWSLLNRALKNDSKTVRAIVKYAKNLNVNSVCDGDSWSAAHQSFYYKIDLDTIKLLISKGMKLNVTNNDGITAVEMCMEHSKHDTISYILKDVITGISSDIAGRMISYLYDNNNLTDEQKEELVGMVLEKNTEK